MTATLSLNARAHLLREKMQDTMRGPLLIAEDVLQIANNWDSYKSEVGDIRFSEWCRSTFGPGKGLAWFEKRRQAVEFLEPKGQGECRRTMHHETAVWLAQTLRGLPECDVKKAKDEYLKAYNDQNKVPLEPGQAARLINRVLGRSMRAKRCSECARLRARVAQLESALVHK